MKKFLLTSLIAFTCILALKNTAFSQNTSGALIYNPEPASAQQQTPVLNTEAVSKKALKDFKKTFSDVEGEKWFKNKDGYTVEFTTNDTKVSVEYDHKGNWESTEKGYAEAQLLQDVRGIIKSAYFDYTIKWVKEITLIKGFPVPEYFIYLENEKGFKNISVHDGELKILNEYQKKQ